MKKISFFLIVFLLLSNNSLSNSKKTSGLLVGCNNEINEESLQNDNKIKIKKIEIDMHNYRRWTINSVRIITSNYRFIPEKYKRRFDAKVIVTYENNIQCIFEGRVRHSGDAKDHISLHENSILQSLDVHLTNGNIRGITKFKLFKPDVRGELNDVIILTELLRNLNYLAPRTIKIDSRINQTESEMLFQEKAAKEMLEYNNRREGPILEGDQKFFFKLVEKIPDNQLSNWSVGTPVLRSKSIKTMLSKQSNSKIIFKSENHKTMSYEALTNLNLIYLYFSNKFQDQKNSFNFFDYDLDNTLLGFFEQKNILKLDTYNLLMQATNSQHGLGVSNRKFYWNAIENYFEPILYDSNAGINREAPTTTTSPARLPISSEFYKAFDVIEKELKNLNIEKMHQNIMHSGINLSKKDLNQKISKILSNLRKIKSNYSNLSEELVAHNKFGLINYNILNRFNDTLNEIDPNVFLVKHNDENGQLQRCKIYLKECEDHYFSNENLSDLLEGEFVLNKKIYQYLGKRLDFKNISDYEKYNRLDFGTSTIYYDEGITINSQPNENLLNIKQNKLGARIYIINGKLENLTINFDGHDTSEETELGTKILPNNFPIDVKGLTGCLSLINLSVKNISIKANKSSCEDAVNLINVKGSISEIDIKDSFSDGLDIDFSDLKINNIKINSSHNDCVDFSAGIYKLNSLDLKDCSDKALSVGEKSFLTLNEIIAEDADIGIASKDSSIVKLNNAYLKNLKTCVSAYNKKQEFNGGFIDIKKMECKNYNKKTDIDKHSIIIKENEILKGYDL